MAWTPYAQRPFRFLRQIVADLLVVAWVTGWVLIGLAVREAVRAVAQVGYGIEGGSQGLAENLDGAAGGTERVPFIGDELAPPLNGAADAARSIAGAGADLGDKITTLSWILALAIALPPIILVVLIWGTLRYRFGRRAAATRAIASTPGGQRLLALRALGNQPVRRLIRVDADPVSAWDRGDPQVTARLAELELAAAGMRLPDAVLGTDENP